MLIHFKIFDKIKVLKVNHNIDCVRQKIKFAESKRGGYDSTTCQVHTK